MPRVLIAGCGYVGSATADLLHEAGWLVDGWTASAKSADQLANKPYRVAAIDIAEAGRIAGVSGDFDAVIQCASSRGGGIEQYGRVYLQGARNLISRFAGSAILFTSSTSVYAQKDGAWVTEGSPAEPEHETGRILREAEDLVLGHGGIVARLAGIYGPGRSALLEKFLSGKAMIDPENNRFVNQIHRDDAAAALLLLINRQSARGQIYNVVDNEPIEQSDCYQWLAQKLNRSLPPTGSSTSARKRGQSNKRVSNAKLRLLGWEPRYSTFADAMEKSILPNLEKFHP